jgi:hypothetical protein
VHTPPLPILKLGNTRPVNFPQLDSALLSIQNTLPNAKFDPAEFANYLLELLFPVELLGKNRLGKKYVFNSPFSPQEGPFPLDEQPKIA